MAFPNLRLAVRGLLKTPGFTVTVVLTLGLGIGANTAIFSLVNDVLLRELPVRDPDSLVLFRNVEGRDGRMSRAGENNGSIDPVTGRGASTSFSLLTFERFRSSGRALSHVFAFAPFNRVTLMIDGQPEPTDMAQFVSGDYFAGFGVSAIAGRTLTNADDQPSAPPVAVISSRFWERRFNRDPTVIGKTIHVNRVHLEQVAAGFNTQRLALFRIEAAPAGYSPEAFTMLQSRLQERLEGMPGVRAATFSRVPMLAGTRASRRAIIPGYTPPGGVSINVNGVAPNFFTAMEIPLLLGRSFTARDGEDAPTAAIVTHAFARRYFAGENPVGRHFTFGANANAPASEVEIVGVAADAKYTTLREAEPVTIYLPASQMPDGVANYYVRTAGDPAAIGPSIRAAVREIDPTLPVIDFRTREQQIERRNSQERLFAQLSGFFGVAALILACVGLYGLMSYLVFQRTGEIGLRLALGAVPGQVLRMVLRESFTLVSVGLLLGLAVAYSIRRAVESMLFGLTAADPLTYAFVAGLLIAVTTLASLRPAQRAARVAPMIALRSE